MPNVLTVARIAITPLMVIALLQDTREGDLIAAFIFAVASATDFVDGWLARRSNIQSSFGKLMDPIADKLLVLGALLPLAINDRLAWWIVAVIILREVAVTVARFAVKRRGGDVIAAAQLGKLKTVVQLWALLLLILFDPAPLAVDLVVYVAVALTVISGIDFFWRTFRHGAPQDAIDDGPAVDRA